MRRAGVPVEYGVAYTESWFGQEKTGWFVDGSPGAGPRGTRRRRSTASGPPRRICTTAACRPCITCSIPSRVRKLFTRSFKTDEADYDKEKVGWKVTVLATPPTTDPTPRAQKNLRHLQAGPRNTGHTYGDALTEEERGAVIEYLKQL